MERGVPLSQLIEHHPDCGVIFICRGCQKTTAVSMERVLKRLAGLGRDARTGVRELATLADRPCERCGALNFESRPDYKPTPKDPGWLTPSSE